MSFKTTSALLTGLQIVLKKKQQLQLNIQYALGFIIIKNKLDSLVKGLYERPGLQLEIAGSVDPVADRDGVRRVALEKQLRTAKWQSLRKSERTTMTPEQMSLTPDERELWISDQEGKKLFIFDATHMPPTPKSSVELSVGGHGWVNFSLDGKYAWCHTPDVFDARTKQQIATLRDENGKRVGSSKLIEVHFRNGKVVAMSSEFGLGRK